MVLSFNLRQYFSVIAIGCSLVMFSLVGTAFAQTSPDNPQPEETFPGVNEVVPRATAVTAKIAEADSQIESPQSREDLYANLDALEKNLETLESQFTEWDNVSNWQINQLLRAQASYKDLLKQQNEPLDKIYDQLETLDHLREMWKEQRNYWQDWQKYLNKTGVKIPTEVFKRTLISIESHLDRITRVSNELIKEQQKYATGQEITSSRLGMISKTLESRRLDTFERNTFAMLDADYYRQFDPKLLESFLSSLSTSVSLPANFFKRFGGTVGLHLIGILLVSIFLMYRSRQGKTVSDEWLFLFRRPLAAATFITIVSFGMFTSLSSNMPLVWKWLLQTVVTLAAMRLINAFYTQPLVKKTVRTIAAIYVLNESIRFFGLPTPLMQLYLVILSGVSIPVCWRLIRQKNIDLRKQQITIRFIFGVALLSFTTAFLGFENLATNLVDSTLSTFIVFILLKMTLRLSDSGIEAFMQVDWIKDRHFMQVLGLDVGIRKLQTILRVFILFNAALYLLVVWMLFDNSTQARDVLFAYSINVGEFSVSVKMVLLVIVVLYLTTLLSWIIQAFVDSQIMTPRKMDIGVKESLKRLTHYGLFTLGFLIAVSMAGLDLHKFTILAGALGVGIGFGLQNIVNNFVSGLILLFERPVKVGDVINIDQDWGTITKIGLRSTVFETFDRSEIIVPNADLVANKVTNWTYSSKIVRVVLPVGVAYGSPLEKVLEILQKAAKEHPDVLSYPTSSPIFVGFGDSSINFELRVWIHTVDDRLKIRSQLGIIIDRLFREEGIQIPFPQRDLHLRSMDHDLQSVFGGKPLHPQNETEGTSQ